MWKNLNKHAIITGGSSGIGKALAKKFAGRGYNVSIISRNQERLNEAINEIKERKTNTHQKFFAFSGDVSSKEEISEAIKKSVQAGGLPSILITSAGMIKVGHFRDLSLEIFEESVRTNYLGTVNTIKTVLPYFEEQKGGHIVMISSGAALLGIYGYSSYSPTKFALRGLGETLRCELKLSQIHVSVVYPPDTDTPQLQKEIQERTPETQVLSDTNKVLSPDQVATYVMKGIDKKKFAIAPTLKLNLLWRFNSFILPYLRYYFDKLLLKQRKNPNG